VESIGFGVICSFFSQHQQFADKKVLYQIIMKTDLNVLTLDIPFWPGSSMCKITIM
jgi:hypothetical protein